MPYPVASCRGGKGATVVAAAPLFSDDFSAALSDDWTAQVGAFETNAGYARAKTLAPAGKNLITNSEFTENTDGWASGGYGGVLTRRDFTLSPNIAPTGGTDDYGVEILHDTANYGQYRSVFPCYVGGYYDFSCRAYSPSANTTVKAAQMKTYPAADSQKNTLEDVWQTLHVALTNPSAITSGYIAFQPDGTVQNDLAYFDAAAVKLMQSIATFDATTADAKVIIKITPHATNKSYFGLVARYSDDTHYWLWRIKPNITAAVGATDFELVEVNGATETIRDSYYAGWTNTQYTLTFEHDGHDLRASINGAVTLQWTDVDDLNTTATLFGLYENAASNAQFDDLVVYPAGTYTLDNTRILGIGDSITFGNSGYNPPIDGLNGYLNKLVLSLTTSTGRNWAEKRIAVGGYTATQIKNIIDAQLAAFTYFTPGYVLVCLGTNTEAEATFKASYGYILDAVHTKYPGAVVITCNVDNPTTNPWLASVIATRAWASIAFDITDLDWAGVHPNETECEAMAELWKDAMGY